MTARISRLWNRIWRPRQPAILPMAKEEARDWDELRRRRDAKKDQPS
jgi:hypothetical protein